MVRKVKAKNLETLKAKRLGIEADCCLIARESEGSSLLCEHYVLGVDRKEDLVFTTKRRYYVDKNGKPFGSGVDFRSGVEVWCLKDIVPVPGKKTLFRMKEEYLNPNEA